MKTEDVVKDGPVTFFLSTYQFIPILFKI